jgi:hypothetical protein
MLIPVIKSELIQLQKLFDYLHEDVLKVTIKELYYP